MYKVDLKETASLKDVIAVMQLMSITLDDGHEFIEQQPHLVIDITAEMDAADVCNKS